MSLDFPAVPSADWPKAINQCCLTLFSLSTHRGPIPGGGDWLHYSIWRNPMSQNPNPFVRGYWNLKIVRTLSISYEDGSPHVWRTIHVSQQHLDRKSTRLNSSH